MGETVRREIGNLADFFKVYIRADQDASCKNRKRSGHCWTSEKTILAPQFGQLATGWVIANCPLGSRGREYTSIARGLLQFGFIGSLQPANPQRNVHRRVAAEQYRNPTPRGDTAEEI